jgi:hypothetical protein
MKAFTIFTILFIPVLILYRNGGAYSGLNDLIGDEPTPWSINFYSLGNLGHREPQCIQNYFSSKSSERGYVQLKCKKGKISKIFS